jgi:hypothetical protein
MQGTAPEPTHVLLFAPISGLASNLIPTKPIGRSRAGQLGPARSSGRPCDYVTQVDRSLKAIVRAAATDWLLCVRFGWRTGPRCVSWRITSQLLAIASEPHTAERLCERCGDLGVVGVRYEPRSRGVPAGRWVAAGYGPV